VGRRRKRDDAPLHRHAVQRTFELPARSHADGREGDDLVLSFTLPNDQHSYPIISYAGEFSLTVGYNAYPPFSAVPEPSTYGFAAAALCTLALWRRRRSAVR